MSDPLQIALIGCGAHSRDHHAVSLARYVKQHSEEVIFKNRRINKAAAADLYGYALPDRTVGTQAARAGSRITLPADAYYTLIR